MSIKDRTESVWQDINLPHFDSIKNNQQTETCIIGGGITGISIAYEMARRGHKVVLVEAFRIGSGQTGRTTAHLTCQLEEQFKELKKIHDEKTIGIFYDAHRSAIDILEENIKNLKIDCDFKRLDGYLFQGKNFDRKKMLDELEAARSCGAQLEWVDRTPLLNETLPALRFKNQAQFNPLKYIRGLAEAFTELGGTIFEGTHIKDIRQEDRENWLLLTDSDHHIQASNLIVATNTPVNNRFHIHTRQFAYRTYAMAFKLSEPITESCLLWDTEDPYHYIRFVDDTLVVGGEDHRTGQGAEQDPFLKLEAWVRKKFNFLNEVVYRWSGQVFEPMDQIGFIGKNPGLEKNVYISTGESGIGMTSAAIASKIIPDLIEEIENPWSIVFDPSRPPVKGIKDFVMENLNVARQYTDWVTPSEVKSLDEIPVDTGSLIREGVSKTCFYHDADHFEKKSAVCTHLGGIVHWNDIEKTWDCPCHGSRFNTKGKVIEGPALSDLMEK